MHPFIAEQLVRAHADDLRREADEARLAGRARAGEIRARPRIRAAVGTRLIRLGRRLAGPGGVEAAEG